MNRGGRVTAALAELPSGTIPVGLGLVVAGLSAYGFQVIAFRVLGAEPYAALNGLWVTAFVLAPGLFLPLEQEIARALAAATLYRTTHSAGNTSAHSSTPPARVTSEYASNIT